MMDLTDRLQSALAHRYKIERKIGEGGMADVYLAVDVRHHRRVAIKIMHRELAKQVGVGRFLREIETTAQLQDPHILPLFDFPRHNATGNLSFARDQLDSLLTAAGLEVRQHTFECAAVRMDVVAQNLSNAETTKTPDGGPYQRRTVQLEAVIPSAITQMTTTVVNPPPMPAPGQLALPPAQAIGWTPIEMTNDVGGVRVASIGVDQSEGAMVYNPGSPDADKTATCACRT